MKNKFILAASIVAAIRPSQEQPAFVGFTPLFEQQQQVKSGTVTSPLSYDIAVEGIAVADPLRTTMGSLTVEALRAMTGAATVVGKMGIADPIRLLHIGVGDSADFLTVIDAATGTTKVADLTWDGGEKNNAPMTNAVADGVGTLSTIINNALEAAKPSFSLAQIVSALEDISLDEEKELVWVFDQSANSGNGRLVAFEVDTEAHAETAFADGLATYSEISGEFLQDTTPVVAADKLAGE
jgi:hypothetical protein